MHLQGHPVPQTALSEGQLWQTAVQARCRHLCNLTEDKWQACTIPNTLQHCVCVVYKVIIHHFLYT